MWSSFAELSRRDFLHWTLGGLTLLWSIPERSFAAANRILPEHSMAGLDFLFVYDQCAAEHLLREIVEILRHLPPSASCSTLVSTPRREEAQQRLAEYGLSAVELVDGGEESLTGFWGRDILQLGTDPQGRKTLFVPWDKSARNREDLERTHRSLRGLASDRREVQLLPVAAEGGNLMADRREGRGILFAGSTIAVETRSVYQAYYGMDPGDGGVADILCDAFGCDEVVWIGPRDGTRLGRQNPFLFHLDMGMTLPARGLAVVGRCDPDTLDETTHRNLLQNEAERTVQALRSRGAWPEGLELPEDPAQRAAHLEERLLAERMDLHAAALELEEMANSLSTIGYEVHRSPAPPRRLRRFQSYTNVVPLPNRVLLPIYPTEERTHGWILRREEGRDRVEVDLGLKDSNFDLSGDNLDAYRLYSGLVDEVRTVRDYFYLAGGNVHCVLARLG